MAERLRRTAGRAQVPVWAGWLIAVAVMLAFVLWLVLFAPAYFVPAPSEADLRAIDAARRLELQNDVRTTLLQGLGGLAVLIGAFFTYRQLRIVREGQVTERFTRAIDQLGNDNTDVRLGGIYALERIANDSPQDRAAIAEVLTAFVRGHAPWPPSHPNQPPMDMPIEDLEPLRTWAPDVQAALTVLGRRKPAVGPRAGLDLSATDLRHANLHEADLRAANLVHSRLQRASLSEAQLQKAHLISAVLQSAHMWETQLLDAYLADADLQEAYLPDANLHGAQAFRAQLQGAILTGAQLQESILVDAQLQKAHLNDAALQGALLYGAQLQEADLTDTHLEEAKCTAKTAWPDGFDWKAAGVTLWEERGVIFKGD